MINIFSQLMMEANKSLYGLTIDPQNASKGLVVLGNGDFFIEIPVAFGCAFSDLTLTGANGTALPTAAELAGTSVTAACDGISFAPALLGKQGAQKQHPYLFWNFLEQGGKQSVLQWPWKLIHLNTGIVDAAPKKSAKNKAAEAKPMEVQLFNLEADPSEQKNVAAENPEIVKRLEVLMQEAWRAP